MRWIVGLNGQPTPIIEEESSIRAFPVSRGQRRIELTVRMRALRPNVALAGTADEKGYGGISLRLARADELNFASGGREVLATVAGVDAGEHVEFQWPASTPPWPLRVTASCAVDGRAWTRWVLRRELSMQNCAFPGQTPVVVPTGRPLELRVVMRVE